MNLDYLREFLVFAKKLNVSEAAKELHLSQPTLSNHIAALEKEAKASLVFHGKRPMLTQAGQALVTQAERVLCDFDGVMSDVQEISKHEMSLSIAICHTYSGAFENLKTYLAVFLQEYPNIYLREPECEFATASEALANQNVDAVAVEMGPLPSDLRDGVVYQKLPVLRPYRLKLLVHKNNPLAQKERIVWADLHGVSTVFYGGSKLVSAQTIEFFRARGIELNCTFTARTGTSFFQSLGLDDILVLDEFYECMPVYSVLNDRVFVSIDEPDTVSQVYLAYRENRKTPAIKALLAHLGEFSGLLQ